MITSLSYKVAIIILLISTIGTSVTATYYYQQQNLKISQASDLNAQTNQLQTHINGLNSQITSLNSQITSLNSHIYQLQLTQAQLTNLTSQITTLTAKITALISHPPTNTTQIASGTLMVAFNGISYIPFIITNAPSYMNVTFTAASTDSYYPASVALYLLTPNQYTQFTKGNYTSSTWSIPYSTSLAYSRSPTLATGQWYIAFQEQDPNGGYPANVAYTISTTTTLTP